MPFLFAIAHGKEIYSVGRAKHVSSSENIACHAIIMSYSGGGSSYVAPTSFHELPSFDMGIFNVHLCLHTGTSDG